jgi:hypothetical protein
MGLFRADFRPPALRIARLAAPFMPHPFGHPPGRHWARPRHPFLLPARRSRQSRTADGQEPIAARIKPGHFSIRTRIEVLYAADHDRHVARADSADTFPATIAVSTVPSLNMCNGA